MLGGQHRSDEATQSRASRANTRTLGLILSESSARVCPEQANTQRKKPLQRPTSLEKPDESGPSPVDKVFSTHMVAHFRATRELLQMTCYVSTSEPAVRTYTHQKVQDYEYIYPPNTAHSKNIMASWNLQCPNCYKLFHYSDIEDSLINMLFAEAKPGFPEGGAELKCPNCGFKSIYQRNQLFYRKV